MGVFERTLLPLSVTCVLPTWFSGMDHEAPAAESRGVRGRRGQRLAQPLQIVGWSFSYGRGTPVIALTS